MPCWPPDARWLVASVLAVVEREADGADQGETEGLNGQRFNRAGGTHRIINDSNKSASCERKKIAIFIKNELTSGRFALKYRAMR